MAQNMQKIRLRSADPVGGAYSAPSDSDYLAGFKGLLLREGKSGGEC